MKQKVLILILSAMVASMMTAPAALAHNHSEHGSDHNAEDHETGHHAGDSCSTHAEKEMHCLHSSSVCRIVIRHKKHNCKITNTYRIHTVQRILNRSRLVRCKKYDHSGGWKYCVKAKTTKSSKACVYVIDKKHIRISGKAYRIKSINMPKLNYCYHHGNYTPILQSRSIKKIRLQCKGHNTVVRSKSKIRRVQKTFCGKKFQRVRDNGANGCIYKITAYNSKEKALCHVKLISKKSLRTNNACYKGKAVNLKTLNKISGID
ncbi:MAG: hypothetical protein ACOYJJ_07330 [Anaerovoracaceae bacterium]|jgi:hypothetical protein